MDPHSQKQPLTPTCDLQVERRRTDVSGLDPVQTLLFACGLSTRCPALTRRATLPELLGGLERELPTPSPIPSTGLSAYSKHTVAITMHARGPTERLVVELCDAVNSGSVLHVVGCCARVLVRDATRGLDIACVVACSAAPVVWGASEDSAAAKYAMQVSCLWSCIFCLCCTPWAGAFSKTNELLYVPHTCCGRVHLHSNCMSAETA